MSDVKRSTYGTTTAEPDQKVGVEVGGGEKFAATKEGESNHKESPDGPHATSENTSEDATPGAGTLPDAGDQDATGG